MRRIMRRLAAGCLSLTLAAGATAALTASATPALAESNGGVRVMPLGDSITDGAQVPGGYRITLWQRLLADGYKVDFVGSGFNGPAGLGDHDHEGHSGWRIDQLDANIVGWLQTYTPRTILLHIGTNDINGNYDVANAPARLSALIDKIRATAPTVELFVAQITPLGNPTLETRVQAFNAAIPGIVAQKGPRTHVVDMHAVVAAADLLDGIHPNAAGYTKMGNQWYAALRSVPGSLSPSQPQTRVVSLRARVNNKYVSADNGGAAPLIAKAAAIGPWEQFDLLDVSGGSIALRARVNNRYVCAENAGAQPLIANRDAVGGWEQFQLIRNGDGSVSLKANVNGRYVTAEQAGNASLIANRTAIGPWEKFDLIG
ncbi:GDSL-type esterase/lipase family protein [Dactylosporangium sp. NPDC049525]|uniref:GDSL-type esterase/lipase family protein n=1 Tax=Dactylosporangium sp. NPDC049525 TaxID=3154730 RepID=UPI00343384ED